MKVTRYNLKVFIVLLVIVLMNCKYFNNKANKDPFDALGIPDINPKTMLEELDKEDNKSKEPEKEKVQLRTIDDLPNFLQKSSLNETEGIEILTRFLIQDDLTLKKYGVVYDQTGFDGIPKDEARSPFGTEERLTQRARSAANINVSLYINLYSFLIFITNSSELNFPNYNMMLTEQKVNLTKLFQTGESIKFL